MSESECEFIEHCPIFAQFEAEGLKNLWIFNYCKSMHEECERKKRKLSGANVPVTLLPNGTYL